MTQEEVSEFLDAVAEQAMSNIRAPHGGYNNAHILGEALKLREAAKILLRFPGEVREVNEEREKN